jgi:thymidylate synthase (FAD)
MLVSLNWATPNGEQLIADIARVSSPENIGNDPTKLITYLLRHKHFSPFEMVNACLNITTTRDIGRQILRHSSLRPQEFSQRYADARKLGDPVYRECRMQDPVNRQNSLPCEDEALAAWWQACQERVHAVTSEIYEHALHRGIAKEVARAVLPEGMTPTSMTFNGPLRTWLHFCDLRMGNGTQRECMDVATAAYAIISAHFPITCAAWDEVRSCG